MSTDRCPDYELELAQEHYYAAGGLPSQSMTPRKAPWFWRRAAKLWRDRAETGPADGWVHVACEKCHARVRLHYLREVQW